MEIDPQKFLDLVEKANSICFLDIEATGLRGDYNSVLVVSILPFQAKHAKSFWVDKAGRDKLVVRQAGELLEEYDCWVTYYGKGFDIPMLNTRRLVANELPIEKRPHVDMYYSLKANLLTARKSQGHLLSWLGIGEGDDAEVMSMPQKMTVSAEMWNKVIENPKKYIPTMVRRCESDVEGLRALYQKTRHLIRDIKR